MKFDLILVVVFILVFFGLWGFAGAQIRAYQCINMLRKIDSFALKMILLILTCIYVGCWATTYFHLLFKCFVGERCHATQNGELIYLATFGCVVLCYESFWRLLHCYLKRQDSHLKI